MTDHAAASRHTPPGDPMPDTQTDADRTTAPDDVFDRLLARMEAAEPVDIAADVAVDNVAAAICEADHRDWESVSPMSLAYYRRLAAAALAAMPSADETLRELLTWLAVEGYEVKTEDTDGPGLTPAEVLARYTDAIGGAR